MVKKFLLPIVCILLFQTLYASDSLLVSINKKILKRGDTLSVDCYFDYKTKAQAAVTLNVWIEDIQKTNIWKFRYPILNGKCSFDLIINDSLPAAKYAINFLVQPSFFSLKGKIKDYKKNNKGLLMLMLDKSKDSYINTLLPDENGNFSVGKIAFKDTANFIFSESGKKKDDLFISIETPLDSSFTAITTYTDFVTVGNPKIILADTIKPYKLNEKSFKGEFTLDEVVVKSTRKKNIEKFDEEYATGLFTGGRIFDGLDGNDLANATDVFMFLSGRVPGMQIKNNDEGGYDITRRGSRVDVYLDEFRVGSSDAIFINPADVAMIKIFDPLEGPSSSGGGSIAIYTKRGNYATNSNRKNNFLIKGYTGIESVWK